jgi:hypothetical protein
VTVYGTSEGVRADPQLGQRLDDQTINQTPLLGRKVTSLPLLNASFRQAKGTGDLFVNATYFATGAGGRRQPAVTMDGATNDDPWGRQTMMATVPVGAVAEMAVLSHAFSAEFGWTSSAAINVVTKSGTNSVHGEGVFTTRPGGMQAKSFGTANFCPPSVPTCVTPPSLTSISAADVPDVLNQMSAGFGAPIVKQRTFVFVAADYTRQNRTTALSSTLPPFVLVDGEQDYTGNYRQGLFNGRFDHKISDRQSLMVRVNVDRFYDTNPQDVVGGTNAPSVGRVFTRHTWSAQVNHTAILGPGLLNEARYAYLDGSPITQFEPITPSTIYTRAGTVPFTVGESRYAHIFSSQGQFSDTLTWSRGRHDLRFGGSIAHATSGGDGTEFGSPVVLGQFTFNQNTTAPLDQLTLADVSSYSEGINYGVDNYVQTQWLFAGFVQDSFRVRSDLTLDLGLRYDRQTFSDGTKNFAPRVGFGWHPGGDSRIAVRGGYGMYYTQLRSNLAASFQLGGLDGFSTYTALPGQIGFPSCLTAPCVPVAFDPATALPSQLPIRNITIRPGQRAFYEAQFAMYGLNFDLLPNYPDALVNPRSQVASIGLEREIAQGLFVSADYVGQHWTDLDRTVDLNAPPPFDRMAPGQCLVASCNQTANRSAADALRPIVPTAGGVRSVNVVMNLGVADYNGLQTTMRYRRGSSVYASASYTLSKSTNTTEPDGNGVGPSDTNIGRLGDEESGSSLLDQRRRAVFTFAYQWPFNVSAGTMVQVASARPFNAITGNDNNGDFSNNERPVIDGTVVGKSAFRGTATSDVSMFVEGRVKISRQTLLLRLEGFNLFNNANIFGRAQTTYGDTGTPVPTFGQLVSVSRTTAIPALANIDTPRMFQFQIRYQF